jgi:hypothetical protein
MRSPQNWDDAGTSKLPISDEIAGVHDTAGILCIERVVDVTDGLDGLARVKDVQHRRTQGCQSIDRGPNLNTTAVKLPRARLAWALRVFQAFPQSATCRRHSWRDRLQTVVSRCKRQSEGVSANDSSFTDEQHWQPAEDPQVCCRGSTAVSSTCRAHRPIVQCLPRL